METEIMIVAKRRTFGSINHWESIKKEKLPIAVNIIIAAKM
jgi:hypothetical protein